jgi:hypothetical protein
MGKRLAKIAHDCLSGFAGLSGKYRLRVAEQGEGKQLQGLGFTEAGQLPMQHSVS